MNLHAFRAIFDWVSQNQNQRYHLGQSQTTADDPGIQSRLEANTACQRQARENMCEPFMIGFVVLVLDGHVAIYHISVSYITHQLNI